MACGRSRAKSSLSSLSPRTSSLLHVVIPTNFFLLCPLSRLFLHQSVLQSGKEQKSNKEHQTAPNHQLSKSVPWECVPEKWKQDVQKLKRKTHELQIPVANTTFCNLHACCPVLFPTCASSPATNSPLQAFVDPLVRTAIAMLPATPSTSPPMLAHSNQAFSKYSQIASMDANM